MVFSILHKRPKRKKEQDQQNSKSGKSVRQKKPRWVQHGFGLRLCSWCKGSTRCQLVSFIIIIPSSFYYSFIIPEVILFAKKCPSMFIIILTVLSPFFSQLFTNLLLSLFSQALSSFPAIGSSSTCLDIFQKLFQMSASSSRPKFSVDQQVLNKIGWNLWWIHVLGKVNIWISRLKIVFKNLNLSSTPKLSRQKTWRQLLIIAID